MDKFKPDKMEWDDGGNQMHPVKGGLHYDNDDDMLDNREDWQKQEMDYNKPSEVEKMRKERDFGEDIKDEKEAVKGYDKTIKEVKDLNTKEQLNKIKKDEVAHKEYLEKAEKDPDVKFVEPEEKDFNKFESVEILKKLNLDSSELEEGVDDEMIRRYYEWAEREYRRGDRLAFARVRSYLKKKENK